MAYVDYDVAVVTNVTHEHLDWHGSWENYMAAKARLFEALSTTARKPGVAQDGGAEPRRPLLRLPEGQARRPGASPTRSTGDAGTGLAAATSGIAIRATARVHRSTPGTATAPVRLRLLGRYNVRTRWPPPARAWPWARPSRPSRPGWAPSSA